MPELQVLNGSLQWKTIPISGARFLIGRKDSCHLILKDGWVSREHTLIMEPKPGEFRVQDLDSENGTFLNGEKIRDTAMKHGDVLRVGRTEMRFMQHTGVQPGVPTGPAELLPDETADGVLRTEAGARAEPDTPNLQTMKTDPLSRTTADNGPKSETHRIDLRERVRRMEASLLDGEQANAALAAENAVLKRSLARHGLLDKKTGALDPRKLTPAPLRVVPDSMLRFVTNPLARITFPGAGPDDGEHPEKSDGNSNPSLLRLGLAGIDSLGIRFAEAVSRLGYRSAVAVTAERDAMRGGVIEQGWRIYLDKPRAGRTAGAAASDHVFVPVLPKIEDVFREAFEGCDRVLLCADAGSPLCGEALTQLADVVRKSGSHPGAVVFCDPADDHVESHARAKAAFEAARTLAESGRLAPFIVIDQSRTGQLANPAALGDPAASTLDSLAGALDALLRLAVLPTSGASLDSAMVLRQVLARGWSTIGIAATRGNSREALEAAYAHALGPGLMAQVMPASRARSAFVCTIVGVEAKVDESALEASRAALARLLPQATRLDGAWHDSGESVRVIAFVGGLPFPETFFTHGHS